MAFYGVGINAEVSRLINEIKLKLANKYGSYGLRQVDQAFKWVDKNNNQYICRQEFMDALSCLGIFMRKIDEQALYKHFDRNNDGRISYAEFVGAFRQPMCPKRLELVRSVFKRLDVNNSGSLCPEEISKRG
jgi:Ca2+-binding EF-hand superfamily protein